MYQEIIYEVDGSVAVITMNRPETLNALTDRLKPRSGMLLISRKEMKPWSGAFSQALAGVSAPVST